ncbi:MAG: 6-pyruvoyl-tetrahydropterin synthase-related protein [Desulfuromonadaceae bacterium]|nr:6-pyruvoyl-tetrahydropterin synthase-related protein [Desulfuromonadaceae bacterium]
MSGKSKLMKNCGNSNNNSNSGWWYIPLLLVSLLPLIPNWLDQRLPATHEGYRYLLLGDWFRDALAAGIWYPRWLPEMNGGFGYPQFVFYQPAWFYLNAFASLFAEPLFLRQLLTLSIIAILGGLGVYRLARCFVSPLYSLLLVLLFQLAPYTHTNLFLRGDLSEWMALELLPWPVLFVWQFCHAAENGNTGKRMRSWLGLALATALLCYCHPTALMFVPLVLLFIGGFCLLRVNPATPLLFLMELTGAVVFGLLLSSPYWLVVVQMKPLVSVSAVLENFVAADNSIGLQQLLFGSLLKEPFWEFIGFPFMLAALIGWWRGRKQPLIFVAGLIYLLFLLLITPFGRWFWQIYPFSLLQFPWRLAMFAPLLQTVCLLGYAGICNRFWRGLSAAGLLLIVAWSWHGHFGFHPAQTEESILSYDQQTLLCLRNFARITKPGSYPATLDAAEWLPVTAATIISTPARGQLLPECGQIQQAATIFAQQIGQDWLFNQQQLARPLLQIADNNWQVYQNPLSSAFWLDYRLNGNSPATVTINQIYLPGWQVMLNGKPVPRWQLEQKLLPDGRIGLELAAGAWHLQAGYAGPPGWHWRSLLITLSAMFAAIYWYLKTKLHRK